jgi:hypothetical protein
LKHTPQIRISQSKGLLSSYSVLYLALAVAIFVWGTGYKLSLYKVERGTSSAPAKVCTRGSDAAKTAVEHANDHPDVAEIPVFSAALFALDQGDDSRPMDLPRDEVVSDLSPLSRAPILYLRPPPDERLPLT